MDGIPIDREVALGHHYRPTSIHSTVNRGTFQRTKSLSNTEEALKVNDTAPFDQIKHA